MFVWRIVARVLLVLTALSAVAGTVHAQIPPDQRRQLRQEMREQWQRMPQEDRQRTEGRQRMPQEDRQRMRDEMRGNGAQFGGGGGGGGGRGQGGGRR